MSKQRKKKHTKKSTPASAMRRFKINTRKHAHEMGDKVKFVETELKMSAVLIDFMEPYMDEVKTVHQYRILTSLAAIAWNAALLPQPNREEMIQKIEQTMPQEHRETVQELIEELIERKQEYFADITRYITHYEITETEDDWHLAIASILTGEEAKQGGYL